MKRLFVIIIISMAAGLFIRKVVFETIFVASGSMEPTLKTGERLISEKLSYLYRNPKKGDIIVFKSPVESGKELIKRVIATGGDKIEIRFKKVYVNGELLDEPYVIYKRQNQILKGDNIGQLEVPPGKLFVMGDNRDESGDSRDWIDPVTKEHIYFIDALSVKARLIVK